MIMPGLDESAADDSNDVSNHDPRFHLIDDVDDQLIANVFLFSARL